MTGSHPAVILVVDDEDDLRLLLRLALERAGFSVLEASDGIQALERYPQADAMLLDIRMPGLDGLEVMRRLPSPPPKPVLAMSAHASEGAAEEARRLGCAEFLLKPFDHARLIQMLHAVLAT